MDDQSMNAAFADQLSQLYSDAADRIDAYIEANEQALRNSGKYNALSAYEQQLTDYSEKMIDKATQLDYNGGEDCFKDLGKATTQIQAALTKIQTINKVVTIAASALTLAGAILTGNVQGIATAVEGVVTASAASTSDDTSGS